jgi:hypothetical protein
VADGRAATSDGPGPESAITTRSAVISVMRRPSLAERARISAGAPDQSAWVAAWPTSMSYTPLSSVSERPCSCRMARVAVLAASQAVAAVAAIAISTEVTSSRVTRLCRSGTRPRLIRSPPRRRTAGSRRRRR